MRSGMEREVLMLDDCDGRIDFLGTGITNLKAARRYLKRKWNQGIPEPVTARLGHRFYTSIESGPRRGMLTGPYASHMMARMHKDRARDMALAFGGPEVAFGAYGTASSPRTLRTAFGR